MTAATPQGRATDRLVQAALDRSSRAVETLTKTMRDGLAYVATYDARGARAPIGHGRLLWTTADALEARGLLTIMRSTSMVSRRRGIGRNLYTEMVSVREGSAVRTKAGKVAS